MGLCAAPVHGHLGNDLVETMFALVCQFQFQAAVHGSQTFHDTLLCVRLQYQHKLLHSSEALSRYMLWRHHRQKPQPSPHTPPNEEKGGRLLGERGEGLGSNTAKAGEKETNINAVMRRGGRRKGGWERENKHAAGPEHSYTLQYSIVMNENQEDMNENISEWCFLKAKPKS